VYGCVALRQCTAGENVRPAKGRGSDRKDSLGIVTIVLMSHVPPTNKSPLTAWATCSTITTWPKPLSTAHWNAAGCPSWMGRHTARLTPRPFRRMQNRTKFSEPPRVKRHGDSVPCQLNTSSSNASPPRPSALRRRQASGRLTWSRTFIGLRNAFAPVCVAEELHDNRFRVAGGSPGQQISWQVTGIRRDAFANAHRIAVEENKPADEVGTYLYPVEPGMPAPSGVDRARKAIPNAE